MYGRVPAWRPMAFGIIGGADVLQLQRNLIALGYASGLFRTPGGGFTPATAAAVERWQAATGQPVTGQVGLGTVVFLPGPVRVGAALVAAGDPASPGQAPYLVTKAIRTVSVPLDPVSAPRVWLGERVSIGLPAGGSTPGRITAIGPPAPPPGNADGAGQGGAAGTATAGSSPAATAVLTVMPLHPRATGTGSGVPVQVALTTEQARGVLAVPVAALLALAGGGYGVEIAGPSGSRRLVAVHTGAFAGAMVQVSGAMIRPGTKVVVAQ
jgi:peptidoglycan hydrolase-like protein with peptidoglycan-binding domain